MLITTGGVLIRTRVKEIREMSRSTQGVTLINLGPEEKLAGLQKIVDKDDDVGPDPDLAPETEAAADPDADPDRIESAAGPLEQDPGGDETS
jgi:DNA gyrase subunit A